ncbi:uncharacterized protein LOC134219980 isoform X2 [Armigeres subalbatus]|uniref:uncharacterized protein LOC134219980 isoform X2 n=1 Tax=Armigeres subalbatus TaxID=124917 RepID=UPI002ED6BDBF
MADDIRNGISCMYWWYNHRVGAKESAPSVCAAWHHLHCIHDGVFLLFLVGLPQSVGVHSSSQTQTDLRGDVPATQFSGEEMYDAVIDAFEPDPDIDKDYIVLDTIRVTRKQRNSYVIAGSFDIRQNWGNQNIVYYTIKKADDRAPPVVSGRNGFCDVFNMDDEVVKQIRASSDLPPQKICPLPKGKYNVTNFEITERMLPLMLPKGQYVLHAKMDTPEGTQIISYKVYATIN